MSDGAVNRNHHDVPQPANFTHVQYHPPLASVNDENHAEKCAALGTGDGGAGRVGTYPEEGKQMVAER